MKTTGFTALNLFLGMLIISLPTTVSAINLTANGPATIYYTTNGANQTTTSTASTTNPTVTMTLESTPSMESSNPSDGYYSLTSSAITWVGTDANRLKLPTSDYTGTYGDEASVTYSLPWSFTFYGQSYSQITADTNGNIWFGYTGSASSFSLPSAGKGPVISAWNNDLSSYYYGGVFVQYKAPDRIVIEWQAETFTDEGSALLNNFEVVLFADSKIRIDYKSFTAANGNDFGSGISKDDGTHYLSITNESGSVYNQTGNSFLFAPAQSVDKALNVLFTGTGSGNVLSTPSGIACNTNCNAQFSSGTPITLHPAASQYSLFSGWTNGTCSGTGDCLLTLNADSSVTANFGYDSAHQVQVSGGSTGYYSTIQAAYNAAANATTIMLWATSYLESLNCNRAITVTLKGGYDSSYTSIVGDTIFNGTLSIVGGAVILDKLTIQ